MIEFANVSKSYDGGRTYAVEDVNLSVEKGRVLALIGESGCGKTTTLKMVNRLIEPTQGDISVDGRHVTGHDPVELRRSIGYVFQGIGLFPHYTIGENVGAVPRLLGWTAPEIASRTDEVLDLVGLEPGAYRDRFPSALSGGQKQRVGVARALAARPEVMLLDEPFGALDPITRSELQDEFRRIQHDLDLTAMLVTHDMTEALLLADHVAVMCGGRVQQVADPQTLVNQPETEYVRKLVALPRERADHLEALIHAQPTSGES